MGVGKSENHYGLFHFSDFFWGPLEFLVALFFKIPQKKLNLRNFTLESMTIQMFSFSIRATQAFEAL